MRSTNKKVSFFFFLFLFLLVASWSVFPFCSNNTNPAEPVFDDEGGIAPAWIISNQVTGKSWVKCPGSVSSVNLSNRFGNRYFLAAEEEKEVDGTAWFLLLKTAASQNEDDEDIYQRVAWVRAQDIITNMTPLEDENTSISYKALISNKLGTTQAAVPLYFNPSVQGSSSHGLSLRSVFYIFGAHPSADSNQEIEGSKSLLIGYNPTLDPEPEEAGVGLLGWVDHKFVSFWNTRQALEIRQKTPIYATKDGARRHRKTDLLAHMPQTEFKIRTNRSPVFEVDRQNDLYRIGYFGQIDPRKLSLESKLRKIKLGMDIHYVIDGSASMGKWFKVVKNVVSKTQGRLKNLSKKSGGSQPTFGVTFYRDKAVRSGRARHPNCSKEAWTMPQTHEINQFLRTMQKELACDMDRDPPESVYFGLLHAIKKADFRKAAYRVVIHIGDAADHTRNGTSAQVLSALHDNNINYFVIDVSQNGRYLMSSMDRIISRLTEVDKGKHSGFKGGEEAILRMIKKSQKSYKKQTDVIRNMRSGFTGKETIDALYTEKTYKQVSKMLESMDINLTDGQQIQLYQEGWINTKNRKRVGIDYEEAVLVRITSLQILMGSLMEMINSNPKPKTISKVWGKIISQYTGDICEPSLKIEKCLKQRGAIAFKSPMMNYSLSELGRMLQRQRKKFYRDIHCPLRATSYRLQGIIEEKQYNVERAPGKKCEYTAKHTGKRELWFAPDNKDRIAWLSASDLP
ncbi:MAG: VWA domain-containing protein [Proteobacteria bacterium]|nr:VWA domain-containing protein [Pseudomonadota bacterium]